MGFRELLQDQLEAARDAADANDLLGDRQLGDWWRGRAQDLEVYLADVGPAQTWPDPSADAVARLSSARAEATARKAALERDFGRIVDAATGSNADDEHDPEGATIGFERAQLGALLDQARARSAELDAASDRLSAGTYGRCERCSETIDPARLQVRPAASTCIHCASVGRP
jgi:RNA polymerase-binding transcription factor DksA